MNNSSCIYFLKHYYIQRKIKLIKTEIKNKYNYKEKWQKMTKTLTFKWKNELVKLIQNINKNYNSN